MADSSVKDMSTKSSTLIKERWICSNLICLIDRDRRGRETVGAMLAKTRDPASLKYSGLKEGAAGDFYTSALQ
jgi:hypothetical protein